MNLLLQSSENREYLIDAGRDMVVSLLIKSAYVRVTDCVIFVVYVGL